MTKEQAILGLRFLQNSCESDEDTEIFTMAIKALEKTPTHKVGKWIRKPTRNDKGGCIGAEMICSCCNKDNRHDEYMDFCPNCGAEMRGVENE